MHPESTDSLYVSGVFKYIFMPCTFIFLTLMLLRNRNLFWLMRLFTVIFRYACVQFSSFDQDLIVNT